jgi:hypothetical protein
MKSSSTLQKFFESSPSSKMALKLSTLSVLLLVCYSMVSIFVAVERVEIPHGCATACPPQRDTSRFICGRNRATNQLGLFESECFFGRFNHCVHVRPHQSESRKKYLRELFLNLFISSPGYEFVRYGHCLPGDF